MRTAPPWTPPTHTEAGLVAAGHWWDAVRTPALLGSRTLGILGQDSGAVIEDPIGHTWYWLIQPGTADGWRDMGPVQVLGRSCYVVVPGVGVESGEGTRWRVPWTRDGYLTDAEELRAALEAA